MSCYVMVCYVMFVSLVSFCSHFAIVSMSPESRCTESRSKHPNTNTRWCIYKSSYYPPKEPARSSTAWTKANGFLSSRPVILTEPGPAVSIPRKLQHQLTFGMPRHGGASRHAPALCRHFANDGITPELHCVDAERFAMSFARRIETESFAKCPSRSHYEPVSGGAAGLGAGPRLPPRLLAGKCAESGCARTAREGSVERCCASAVGTSA